MPEPYFEPAILAELLTCPNEILADAAKNIILEISSAKANVGVGHMDALEAIVEEAMRRFKAVRGIE